MSNAERQRLFRERHPGYYGRLHRERKAAALARLEAARAAAAAQVTRREPLMLPAPVEQIEIPGLNAIPIMAHATPDKVYADNPSSRQQD